jgi:hypothetical protein
MNLQIGDVPVVFFGSTIRSVLRPQMHPPNDYAFLSERHVHVHRVRDGEVIENWGALRYVPAEEFSLE